ncbi:MAG: hypothetical protein QXU45_00625 [Candidatus Bathyarchaeia archaeon]
MVKVELKRNQKAIYVNGSGGILEPAEKLKVSVGNAAFIQKVIHLGIASPYSEEQLLQKIKALEERKRALESELKEIANQFIRLESRHVGLRTQISKIFNDNRIQVFHLCARYSPSTGEENVVTNIIQKYIEYSKSMWF